MCVAKEDRSYRPDVIRFESLINRTHEAFKKGQLIDERDVGVDRKQFKNIITALKDRKKIDVLTVYRGNKTIGWILADEVL